MAISLAVDTMNCIIPRAAATDFASAWKRDSCRAIASTNLGSTFLDVACFRSDSRNGAGDFFKRIVQSVGFIITRDLDNQFHGFVIVTPLTVKFMSCSMNVPGVANWRN